MFVRSISLITKGDNSQPEYSISVICRITEQRYLLISSQPFRLQAFLHLSFFTIYKQNYRGSRGSRGSICKDLCFI